MPKDSRFLSHSEVAVLIECAWQDEQVDIGRLGMSIGPKCPCGCERRYVGLTEKESGETFADFVSVVDAPSTTAAIKSLVRRAVKGEPRTATEDRQPVSNRVH